MKNLKSGFTLIELVVVMLIIGILAATAISKLGGSDKVAYETSMKADGKNALAMINNFYAANQEYPDASTATATGSKVAANAPSELASTGTPTGSGMFISASPWNTVTYAPSAPCTNGSEGYTLDVTSDKVTDKSITFDSCVDAAITLETI